MCALQLVTAGLAQAGAEANFQLFQAMFFGSVLTVCTFNALPDASLQPLAATLKDDTTDIKRTVKRQAKCQRLTKLKELQADTQANSFAAHLILPNRTQSPPTTQTNQQTATTFGI